MRVSLKLIVPAALALTAAACGKPAQAPQPAAPEAAAPAPATAQASATTPPAVQTAEAAPPVNAVPEVAKATAPPAGDVDRGKALFAQCRSCHTVVKDGADMIGPNLHGVFGRRVGTKPGYNYSPAMRAATFTWDPANMDKWLINPKADIPGTKMTFLGIEDPADRANLVAYLAVATK